jgi:hypothetical protein
MSENTFSGHGEPASQKPLPNGDGRVDPNPNPAAAAVDNIEAAVAMPNIDGRPNVLDELPADLFVEYREDFAIREEVATDEVRWGRPRPQDIARCHDAPSRKRVVWGLRDSRSDRGHLFIVPQSLLDQHPRLKTSCKLYLVRQFVTTDGVTGLWPAPLPGLREAASDASHLEAQEYALTRWIRLEWNGRKFICYLMSEADDFGDPQFPEESFDEIIAKGLKKWVISSADHPLCKHLLKGTLVSPHEHPEASA